ncbi:hypothetical protein FQN54_001989 [Arachnomyces sp. PD_36]|nr:hypothetical protein FQN54_001989 [Arachnomyces sp. PD_36]
MLRSSLLSVALLAFAQSGAAYTLVDDFSATNFFPNFDFFTSEDPTHGFVKYVDAATAHSTGLTDIKTDSDGSQSVYMGVDYTNITHDGRPSVRITSKKSYNHGLFIGDFSHMPGGVCGTWPAFWMLGPNWPVGGEVDILEGVHQQTRNNMVAHTNANCSIQDWGFSGSLKTDDCDVEAPDQSPNAGCRITSTVPNSYGTGFNKAGGGVYAMEWTPEYIKIWFFTRAWGGTVPLDIELGHPDPKSWGFPDAAFQGPCDINDHFYDMQIIFDTTFCGDWAEGVWAESSCSDRAPTCLDFVRDNPAEFEEAYWGVNSVKVYQ